MCHLQNAHSFADKTVDESTLAMLNSLLLAMAAQAAVAATGPTTADARPIDPRTMSQAQVRAHNATLSATDPNYIRCVKSDDTGSLVRKRFSCRTNAMWEADDSKGNQNARDTFEAMQGKAINQAN